MTTDRDRPRSRSLNGHGELSPRAGVWHLLDSAVPATARGSWCILSCDIGAARSTGLRVEFLKSEGTRTTGLPCNLASTLGQLSYGVCFVPADAERARPEVWGPPPARNRLIINYYPIGRVRAAALVALTHPVVFGKETLQSALQLHRPRLVFDSFRSAIYRVWGPSSCKGDYTLWSSLFDSFGSEMLQGSLLGPSLGLLVFDTCNNKQALSATLRSLAEQRGPGLPHAIVGGATKVGLETALSSLPADCDYIGILQSGEMLAPHAALLARARLDALGLPALVYADEDVRLERDGSRGEQLFKPEPNRTLMLSGTLSRGLWLVRRGLLAVLRGLDDEAADWAEAVRLLLWLNLYEAGATRSAGTRRLPFVLTHRRPDTAAAPSRLLSRIVEAHLGRTAMPLEVASEWPMRLRARPLVHAGRVSIIVASALRSTEVERCIRAVLCGTQHDDLELIVGVSQPGPLDPTQRAVAARIEADPRAKVVSLRADCFNFSWTNNQCAKLARGEQIVLLNDDVCPRRSDWLRIMLAHLADPAVGVVGAKLLYPNGTIQHGGVIMGLGGLCDHAFRGLAGDAPGYAARAVLPQELSAVTGACLLIRTSLLRKLGGLDEGYPSAFNDVDLCLRAREAGYAVVFTPEAVLYHLESHTYGSHYAGERGAFKEGEIERLRTRWARDLEEDPFHSPNLSLWSGREWEPAFPPRTTI